MKVLGIDIGGSAFKGAPVDTKTGRLLAERHRVEVDAPCPTAQGLAAAREIARHFQWRGPVGNRRSTQTSDDAQTWRCSDRWRLVSCMRIL